MNPNCLSIAFLAAATLAASTASAAERRFPVTGFDKILASGSEDVTIVTGKAASVVATGPQERLDRLVVGMDGTTLTIGHKSGGWNMNWGDKQAVRIAITMPALRGLHASGSGDITADSGTGPDFAASTSGSGNLAVRRIESPAVALKSSGSGDIAADGQCATATIATTGSGDVAAEGLRCRDVKVTTTGSGDVAVQASGTAEVRTTGSGDVDVAGAARCTSRTSGSGNVRCG